MLWTDFHETWWIDETWTRDESVRFGDGSGPAIGRCHTLNRITQEVVDECLRWSESENKEQLTTF